MFLYVHALFYVSYKLGGLINAFLSLQVSVRTKEKSLVQSFAVLNDDFLGSFVVDFFIFFHVNHFYG